MSQKESTMIILSNGNSMLKKYQDSSLSRLDFGKDSIRQLLRQKLIFSVKRDEIGVILTNENEDCFLPLTNYSPELLEQIENINCEENSGDIFLCVENAIEIFQKKYKKLKWNKKIFLITDGESPSQFDQERIEFLAEKIDKNDIKMNIICVDFFDELENDDDENIPMSTETKSQQNTKKLLKTLEQKTKNIKIFTSNQANYIYHQFKKKKNQPRHKIPRPSHHFPPTPTRRHDLHKNHTNQPPQPQKVLQSHTLQRRPERGHSNKRKSLLHPRRPRKKPHRQRIHGQSLLLRQLPGPHRAHRRNSLQKRGAQVPQSNRLHGRLPSPAPLLHVGRRPADPEPGERGRRARFAEPGHGNAQDEQGARRPIRLPPKRRPQTRSALPAPEQARPRLLPQRAAHRRRHPRLPVLVPGPVLRAAGRGRRQVHRQPRPRTKRRTFEAKRNLQPCFAVLLPVPRSQGPRQIRRLAAARRGHRALLDPQQKALRKQQIREFPSQNVQNQRKGPNRRQKKARFLERNHPKRTRHDSHTTANRGEAQREQTRRQNEHQRSDADRRLQGNGG